MSEERLDVAIIGAGLSGLTAAIHLQESNKNLKIKVFEADAEVGGRVQTDDYKGFLLDRGFQVLLTAYPECKAMLDYDALNLKPFVTGAKVRYQGKWELMSDPLRAKGSFLKTLKARNASLMDKIRIFFLSRSLKRTSLDKIWSRPEMPTYNYIRLKGFSDKVLMSFFVPFMGGVFLERALNTSSRFFEFVFKMFAEADIAVPAKGMGEIPKQLAAMLAPGTIELNAEVVDMDEGVINVSGHGLIYADKILIATDGSGMKKLMDSADNTVYNRVTCVYFAAEKAPEEEAILLLNGESEGYVNNVVVMSHVSPAYSTDGRHLVSVSLVRNPEVEDVVPLVRNELEDWFGPDAQAWEHLKTYHLPKALPAKESVNMKQGGKELRPGLYACGDYLLNGSINGAMQSGRDVAALILSSFN